MGICQTRYNSQSELKYSTKALLKQPQFGGVSLYFTTYGLARLDADWLVMFVGTDREITRNRLISKLPKIYLNLIKRAVLNAAEGLSDIKTKSISLGDSNMRFSNLLLVETAIWADDPKGSRLAFSTNLKQAMYRLQSAKASSVVIAYPAEQLGIPANVVAQELLAAISSHLFGMNVVTIVLESDTHQNLLMSAAINFVPPERTKTRSIAASVAESVYF